MNRPARLTSAFVESVRTPGRYGDGRGGNGLSLRVRPAAGGGVKKTWEQRILVNGRTTCLGLGAHPARKLPEAREQAAANAVRIRERFPRRSKLDMLLSPGALATSPGLEAPPFRVLAAQHIEAQRGAWKPGSKTEAQLTALLDTYINPVLGDTPADEITSDQIHDVLSPHWHTKPETAKKIKTLLRGIFRLAMTKRYLDVDPVHLGTLALGKQRHITTGHESIPYKQVGEALRAIRKASTYDAKRLALEFIILTAARTSEVRQMRAGEIDLTAKAMTWTVPAEHMKGRREHWVPLSVKAGFVLMEAGLRDCQPDELVFKTPGGKMLGADVLREMLQREYPGATTHGFRSSFRNWAADETDYPGEVAEHALAHLEGSTTVRSYRTTTMFNKRRAMMEDWARYIRA